MLIGFEELKQHFLLGSPKGVIHVGAHGAEELESYVQNGVKSVAWIEANPMLAEKLINRTLAHIGSTVHFFAAHEIDNLIVELNIANNGESSSLLDFGTHLEEHPHVNYIGKINVPTCSIDTFLESKGFNREIFDFANIDIQGAELIALRGMKKQLAFLKYLYLEVNEKPLYKGCAMIDEIDEYLFSFGFERKETKMTHHGWGDAFYSKTLIEKN